MSSPRSAAKKLAQPKAHKAHAPKAQKPAPKLVKMPAKKPPPKVSAKVAPAKAVPAPAKVAAHAAAKVVPHAAARVAPHAAAKVAPHAAAKVAPHAAAKVAPQAAAKIAPHAAAKVAPPAAKIAPPAAKVAAARPGQLPRFGDEKRPVAPQAPARAGQLPARPAAPAAPMAPARRPLAPPLAVSQPLRAEQPKQSLARSFYWSELRVGDDLPPLTKPAVDRVQVARYAAASGDFNRLHLDEPFAHHVGFPGVFAPGMLAMGFVGQLLTSWLRRGHVRRLSARFVKIVWPQDELTCRGRIGDLRKEHGGCYADVELWAENQKGELVLRGQATCELYESPAAAGGDGAGFLFGAVGSAAAKAPASAQRAASAPSAQPARSAPPPPKKK